MSLRSSPLALFICSAATASASEANAFRLLAVPMPWSNDVSIESFIDLKDKARLDSGQNIGFRRFYASAAFGLISTEQSTLLAEVTGDHIDINSSAPVIFPGAGRRVPNQVIGLDLGVSGRYIDADRRRWVASTGVLSRSSDPDDDSESLRWRIFGAVFIPTKGFDGWTIGLRYVTETDFPLPLVAYTWAPSREFMLTLGLPYVFVRWQPDPKWELQFRNFAVNPGAQVNYKATDTWSLFTRITTENWDGQAEGRRSDKEQLSQDGWRAGIGTSYAWQRDRELRLELGWEFERELVLSEKSNIFDSDEETIDLDDAAYLRVTANWTF